MILKILLTLAVVIAVFIWLRSQNSKRQLTNSSIEAHTLTGASKNTWIKPFAYSMASFTLAVGILLYYLSWQEDHTLYQVTITNPQTGSSETYTVLKKDMYGRMFITEGGLQVNASQLERIEIKKIETD